MERKLFEITFESGESYRVICTNKNQVKRLEASLLTHGKNCKWKCISNGIHNINEFQTILNNLD